MTYPPIGKIAVMSTGGRIEVWPNESGDGCFTGLLLLKDRSYTETVCLDLSCMWDMRKISRVEEPTEADRQLCMLLEREA